MSDQPSKPDRRDRATPARSTPQRPPIQWPKRGVSQTSDTDRATEFARSGLNRTYQVEGEPNAPKPAKKVIQPLSSPEPAHTTADLKQSEHTLRDEPYDWQQYHNAWQQYYHQYFYRYYAVWWQQQRQQNQTGQTAQSAQTAETVFARSSDQRNLEPVDEQIKKDFRNRVKANAKKFQTSSHFKPLLGALSVAVIFLSINYNQVMIGAAKQYVAPGNIVTTPVIVEPNVSNTVGQEPKIIIPKIGVEAPVVYDEPNVDEKSYQNALERGVVRLGNTANPGTNGNVVIGGHSSNNVFNKGGYKYVFVNLKQLDVGDIFYLHYNGTRYTYKVTTAKKVITPRETSVLNQTPTPTVTLFTCDPPGTNVNRLIVQAEQIDPSPTTATANTNQESKVNPANPLPSVAPSLWDRLFGR